MEVDVHLVLDERMRAIEAVVVGALGGLILGLGCNRVGRQDAGLPLPPRGTGEAGLHAVQSQQLRDVMVRLRGLEFQRSPQELDDLDHQQVSLEQASAIAMELAGAANRIAEVAPETGLPSGDQTIFIELARELHAEATGLSADAAESRTGLFRSSMRRIEATCVKCHQLFRDVGGETIPFENRATE